MSPSIFVYLEPLKSEFLHVNIWLTNQNCVPFELEDRKKIDFVQWLISGYKSIYFVLQ